MLRYERKKARGQDLPDEGSVPSWCRGGQALMEFSFCMIVVLLMIYGTFMVFRWAGLDLAERRMAHDRILTVEVNEIWGCLSYNLEDPPGCSVHPPCDTIRGCCPCLRQGPPAEEGPLKQLESYFYKPIGMNAVWQEKIFR